MLFSGISFIELLYRLPAIVLSLSIHEWAHAYAAYRCGDPTARNLGRMTINPIAHLDPIGFLCMLLTRFGWAKPVPVNPRNFNNFKKANLIVSLAGITANFAIAFTSFFLIFLLYVLNVSNYAAYTILENFMFINLALMVFNLLPVPPLDGYRAWEGLLIRKFGPKPFNFLNRYGSIILIILVFSNILTGIVSFFVTRIYSAMYTLLEFVFGGIL